MKYNLKTEDLSKKRAKLRLKYEYNVTLLYSYKRAVQIM